MKSEPAFLLENASWPALLVDSSGIIRSASAGARKLFGSIIEGKKNLAQSIWSRENELTPEQFISEWTIIPDIGVELRFRGRDGNTSSYRTHICPSPEEIEGLFLLQLFKVPPAPEEPHDQPILIPSSATPPESSALVEASFAQKQKLDCAMQLIRSVALDFNNALTTILGHSSLLLSKTDAKNPWRNSLGEIEKSAQKAAEIAHDLADFSRQDKDQRSQQSGNLNDVVRRTVDYLKEANPESLVWKLQLEHRPYTVKFDEAKVQQALIKILENGLQAMDASGSLSITTKNLEVTDEARDNGAKLSPGPYFCIEVQDTGSGIPPEIQPRIFEPFFTTRKAAGHRGLGLAWVYGIITNHGGTVTVSSEVGQGTVVRLFLPAQKKTVDDRAADSGNLSGDETILMIDDEDLLLTMGEMVLSSFGYQVLTANSGQKALEIFTEKAQEIDLVITDLVMPQMSGRELIERLRRISPDVKVICASGFVRPPSTEQDENYLQKPFASQDLLRKVKQVLAAGTEAKN